MPFEMFDRSRLKLLPLEQRIHDLKLETTMLPAVSDNGYRHPRLICWRSAYASPRKRART